MSIIRTDWLFRRKSTTHHAGPPLPQRPAILEHGLVCAQEAGVTDAHTHCGEAERGHVHTLHSIILPKRCKSSFWAPCEYCYLGIFPLPQSPQHLKSSFPGAEEVAGSVKCFPQKHKEPSTLVKRRVWYMPVIFSILRRERQAIPWLVGPAKSVIVRRSQRPCLKK